MSKEEELTRSGTDWTIQIRPEELIEGENGKPMVPLAELRRLARLAGMVGSSVKQQHVPVGERGVFQCIYTAQFDDSTSWSASADCNQSNCEKPYLNYPTAVAESRAAARCLRDALGITMLTAEEVGFDDSPGPRPTGKIDQQVVKMLEIVLQRKNLDPSSLFQNVLTKSRAEKVVELKDLTTAEGQSAMQWVNKIKSAAKKSARDERKAELERKLGENRDG